MIKLISTVAVCTVFLVTSAHAMQFRDKLADAERTFNAIQDNSVESIQKKVKQLNIMATNIMDLREFGEKEFSENDEAKTVLPYLKNLASSIITQIKAGSMSKRVSVALYSLGRLGFNPNLLFVNKTVSIVIPEAAGIKLDELMIKISFKHSLPTKLTTWPKAGPGGSGAGPLPPVLIETSARTLMSIGLFGKLLEVLEDAQLQMDYARQNEQDSPMIVLHNQPNCLAANIIKIESKVYAITIFQKKKDEDTWGELVPYLEFQKVGGGSTPPDPIFPVELDFNDEDKDKKYYINFFMQNYKASIFVANGLKAMSIGTLK
ncbi:hypothetical protein [Desulfobacula toluolica]|nr:hypothetical protein [Desulfobacula toluolica]